MANILITGASGDIGIATALLFIEKGHNVFLTYNNNVNRLTSALSEYQIIDVTNISTQTPIIKQGKNSVYLYKVDVSDDLSVKACVNTMFSIMGSIDLLINNAGISIVGLDHELDVNDWQKILNTNLSSVTYFSRAVVPSMVSSKTGRIINISSMWGNYGASCEAAYSATKGGINAYTKALGKELAPSHIPVNAIAFGAIDTKMNSHLSDEEKEMLCEEIPYGRMATPKEAAEMIYLIYQAPDYLTGQIIGFDGGY